MSLLKSRSAASAAALFLAVALSAIFASPANAGSVNFTDCGSAGTVNDVRVSDSSGAVVSMNPGARYDFEIDLTPSVSALAATLLVTSTYLGYTTENINQVLPASMIAQGQQVTVRFTITPNDILSGNDVPVTARVTVVGLAPLQACVTVQTHVN
ncbi:hypothetical protein ACFYO1_14245 [Nocardia sp. NPDC006044]|uniref:hypothetical protein n=1 Tax=Nocardia sp. NPDC006044 TaxID=3364306 RepID=UPI0036B28FF7